MDKIDHDYDDFEKGSEYILTLQDAPLIDKNTNTLVEAPTILENLGLQEVYQAHKKITIRNKSVKYNPTTVTPDTLLPQYDAPKQKEGITFNEDGNLTTKVQDTITDKGIDLNETERAIPSDFEVQPRKRVAIAVEITKPINNVSSAKLNSYDEEESELQNIDITLGTKLDIQPIIEDTPLEGYQWDDTKEFISCIVSNTEEKIDSDNRLKNLHMTLKDAADGKTSVMNISLPSEKYKYKEPIIESIKEPIKETEKIEEKKLIEVVEQPQITEVNDLSNELPINRSCAIAISLMAKRGMLKDYEFIGKRKGEDEIAVLTSGDLMIEHRDKHGKLLSRKEAFKQQCNSFHGITESKTRQERKKKKALMEMKSKIIDHSSESALARALAITQQAKAQPFMVLEKKRVSTIF